MAVTLPGRADRANFVPNRRGLSLMWGGESETRRLRESIAVAISAANQCFY